MNKLFFLIFFLQGRSFELNLKDSRDKKNADTTVILQKKKNLCSHLKKGIFRIQDWLLTCDEIVIAFEKYLLAASKSHTH